MTKTKWALDFGDYDLTLYQSRKRKWPRWFPEDGTEYDSKEEAVAMMKRCILELNERAMFLKRGDCTFSANPTKETHDQVLFSQTGDPHDGLSVFRADEHRISQEDYEHA
jgi:hypothetical protein